MELRIAEICATSNATAPAATRAVRSMTEPRTRAPRLVFITFAVEIGGDAPAFAMTEASDD